MGNQVAYAQGPTGDVHSLLLETPSLSPEGEPIASSKLFKSLKCFLEQPRTIVIAKVYIKRNSDFDSDLSDYKNFVSQLQVTFNIKSQPNVLLNDCIETQKAGILIRQYFETTLYQKIIRPPFLSSTEKKWLAFQMVAAVKQLHSQGFAHGDIKSENFLVTSWNWVFLSDISFFFKPTYIAEGDMTAYKCFFTRSKLEKCNLAPERFITKEKVVEGGEVAFSMDIFSLGCVIAELFQEGIATFTLAQLLAYRRGENSLDNVLSGVPDPQIKELLKKMLALNPFERIDIQAVEEAFKTEIIPKTTQEVLYPFVKRVVQTRDLATADSRIYYVASNLKELKERVENYQELSVLTPLLASSIRNTKVPSSRLKAVECLKELGVLLPDLTKLHYILPYLVAILTTKEERYHVKVAAFKATLEILNKITSLSSKDSSIFEDYIWPSINVLKNDESEWVKCALAENLPQCVKLGKKFIELSRYSKKQAGVSLDPYEVELEKFFDKIVGVFKDMLVARPASVLQEILLSNFSELCSHFDKKFTLNKIVSLVIAWLNKGELYRILILQQLPKLLDTISTSAFVETIYPCIEDGLMGHSEMVVYYTLSAVRRLPKPPVSFLEKAIVYILHPNQWIRTEIIELIKSLIATLDPIDNYCILRPLISPYITIPVKSLYLVTNDCIDSHLQQSFKRSTLEDFKLKNTLEFTGTEKNFIKHLEVICKICNEKSYLVRPPTKNQKLELREFEANQETNFKYTFEKKEPNRQSTQDNYNFQGKFQLCLNEHEASVTHLKVVDSAQLVFSASKDGTVKVWDFKQLETLSPLKSKQTLRIKEPVHKFSGLALCENQLLVACEDEIQTFSLQTLEKVHSFHSPETISQVVAIDANTFAYVTQKGCLKFQDLRTKQLFHKYEVGSQRGICSCLCEGPDPRLLALGTISGYLLLYDMRFHSSCASFLHSKEECISSMQPFTPDQRCMFLNTEVQNAPYMLASAGSEVILWEIQSGRPAMYMTQDSEAPLSVPYLRQEPSTCISLNSLYFFNKPKLPPNDIFRRNFLSRFSEYSSQSTNLIQNWAGFSHRIRKGYEKSSTVRKVIGEGSTVLSGGQDCMVRYWDLQSPSESFLIGQDPSFRNNFHYQMLPDVLVVQEGPVSSMPVQYNPLHSSLKRRDFEDIPLHRKTAHTDCVLDLSIVSLQKHSLLLSASRDGTIRVWN